MYLPAVVLAGAEATFVPLEPPDFRVDVERLRETFSPRTKAIIVNTPHNPTGRVFTRDELEGIAALCQEFDVLASHRRDLRRTSSMTAGSISLWPPCLAWLSVLSL